MEYLSAIFSACLPFGEQARLSPLLIWHIFVFIISSNPISGWCITHYLWLATNDNLQFWLEVASSIFPAWLFPEVVADVDFMGVPHRWGQFQRNYLSVTQCRPLVVSISCFAESIFSCFWYWDSHSYCSTPYLLFNLLVFKVMHNQ